MKEVFGKVAISVFRDQEVSGMAKLVYGQLCTFAHFKDRTEPVWPSTETMATLCGISHTSVKKAYKELQEKGIIRREQRYRQSALTYILK